LLRRPPPEPAPAVRPRLPLWAATLLAAGWLLARSAPRGPGPALAIGRWLAWLLLPLALSFGMGWRLCAAPPTPVRATLEVSALDDSALLQRSGRSTLALAGRPESLATWPEWAPASLTGTWIWPSGEEAWSAVAPGARLVERRLVPAPGSSASRPGLSRWRRQANGGLSLVEPSAGGRTGPAAPTWALWPAAPGQDLELLWSGSPADPVWRLLGAAGGSDH
jgi:hypothetical protein